MLFRMGTWQCYLALLLSKVLGNALHINALHFNVLHISALHINALHINALHINLHINVLDHRVGRIFHFLLDPGAHKYPPGYGDLRDFFSGMEIFLSQPKREPDQGCLVFTCS